MMFAARSDRADQSGLQAINFRSALDLALHQRNERRSSAALYRARSRAPALAIFVGRL
jgi:hypothetical protein